MPKEDHFKFKEQNIIKKWLKWDNSGQQSATFIINLRRYLDPVIAQSDAVNLNLKLIQWRILPQFDKSKIQNLRFLLIGMGTLGCSIARNLVGWGVTKLTLIDNGKVSLSSPVRQCLYTHRDALDNGGKYKVIAAKERLLEIRPDLLINAIPLEIPMPGHARFLSVPDSENNIKLTLNYLERIIDAHDVIYLLTDSRESRWLPSLLSATRFTRKSSNNGYSTPPDYPFETTSEIEYIIPNNQPEWLELFKNNPTYKNPLTITVALGFDSFVVLRHGIRKYEGEIPLACYFCNDLASPADTASNRPLDQQCTVTRPGISFLASSIACELIAAISQHPLAPDPPHISKDLGPTVQEESCLGAVPHTVRGTLSGFSLASLKAEAFTHCVCCSESICKAYSSDNKLNFIKEAIKQSDSLEKVSGLSTLKKCYRVEEVINFDDEFNE